MMRREWIIVAAVWLGGGLLPGCWHTQGDRPDAFVLGPGKPDPDPPRPGAAESPYHGREVQLPASPTASEAVLKQTSYPQDGSDADPIQPPKPEIEHEPPTPEAQVQTAPPLPPPDEPLVAALRCFLARRPAEALQWIERYEKPNQELLLLLLPAAAWLTRANVDRAPPHEVTTLVDQFDNLGGVLRARAALAIDKMCFCRLIRGYGMFEPFAADHAFRAGSDGQEGELMQLYVEVRNFSSRPAGSAYETCLASRAEIHNEQGELVWRKDLPVRPDRSQSLRHDYFINYRIPVPPHVAPGKYKLVIEVRDVTGQAGKDVPPHRMARRELSVRIIGEE